MNNSAFYLICALFAENKPIAHRLQTGLALAYTPPNGNGEKHRLVASRVGVEIGIKEQEDLQQALMVAMRKKGWVGNGRFPIKPTREEVTKKGTTHHCLVWTWVIATVEL